MDEDLEILVSNQRRELLAARDAESDLDFAFRLQIQEAMTASLSLQPSSSTSPPPPLPPTPLHLPNKDDDDYDTWGVSQILALQTIELERFHQERGDTKHCQAEMRRVSEDLRLRAYDSKFAREISEMPDEDWEEYGDNFEKPIGQGVSEDGANPFKLYFKGMSCDVPLNGSVAHVSAVGVAVCDPENKVILKVQKPLPGSVFGREFLETKALIEGLNAVLSLGIKNVNVFCDNVPLYNHITGKWAVKQRKIANIINQASLLQRKIGRCNMFLLPRSHVQFVIKLAKDAIDSQVTKSGEVSSNNSLKETCTICLEDTESSEMFAVDDCLHRFCFSCMKQHVEVKLLHGIVPGCPHEGCNIKLNVENSKRFLTPKLIVIMTQHIKESSIPPTEKVYCPYPKCSALMSRSETISPVIQSSSKQPQNSIPGLRKCIKCDGCFCINCKVPWHDKMSCYEYKRYHPHPRTEEANLQSLARQKLWRQCVKCNHMIELAEGCFHITCRCGYEFCYTCGAEWINKKATCTCPLWDEHNILYGEDEHNILYSEDEDFYDSDDDYGEYDSEEDYY